MPKIVDELTGEIVAEEDYTPAGVQRAADIAATNPGLEVEDYEPGALYGEGEFVGDNPFPIPGPSLPIKGERPPAPPDALYEFGGPVNATERSVTEYAGGGKTGFKSIGEDLVPAVDPIPEPEYRGRTFDRYAQEWEEGGKVPEGSKKGKK